MMESPGFWLRQGIRNREKSAFIEVLILLVAFSAYILSVIVLRLGVGPQLIFTAAALILLLALSWKNFQHGMHPCFLFLALLTLFQGGGLFAHILSGGSTEPLQMFFAENPYPMPKAVQTETLSLLLLSALCVYVPVRLSGARLPYAAPSSTRLLPFLVVILVICLPFHFWKNYEYLTYVRSHGGYLAIFRSDEHIAEAGFVVRALSALCSSAYLVYFVYERPGRRMFWLSFVYFLISVVELLIGLRGKVMLLAVCFFFLWKLKRGDGFNLRGLTLAALLFATLATFIGVFRESRSDTIRIAQIPQAFLSGEGTPIALTEAAIAYREQFTPFRWAYLNHGIRAIFQSEALPQARLPQGEILDNDTSMFLIPTGFNLGFGTGGSYIAEGFIFGRIAGVIGESFLVSALLILIARNFRGWRCAYAWTVMTSVVYLPRANITTMLSPTVHNCIGILAVFLLAETMARTAVFLANGFGHSRAFRRA